MKKRWVYRVLWRERDQAWIVRPDGGTIYSRYRVKAEAVADGRRLAREIHEADGQPTQLVIHTKSGRIQRGNGEATYGADPVRSRG